MLVDDPGADLVVFEAEEDPEEASVVRFLVEGVPGLDRRVDMVLILIGSGPMSNKKL